MTTFNYYNNTIEYLEKRNNYIEFYENNKENRLSHIEYVQLIDNDKYVNELNILEKTKNINYKLKLYILLTCLTIVIVYFVIIIIAKIE